LCSAIKRVPSKEWFDTVSLDSLALARAGRTLIRAIRVVGKPGDHCGIFQWMIAVELFAVSFDSSPLGTDSLSSNLAEECLPQISKERFGERS